ncbi:hypothetical protein PUN28_013302 [Cardiocondyla obscurior]|uniref:Uncharacterized protein n=1 Tax=Cardiocondyla obscurior TaxID=286306 RepID=A0AAW2F921_9HYME
MNFRLHIYVSFISGTDGSLPRHIYKLEITMADFISSVGGNKKRRNDVPDDGNNILAMQSRVAIGNKLREVLDSYEAQLARSERGPILDDRFGIVRRRETPISSPSATPRATAPGTQ